jgi:uncharacterized protein
MNRRQFLTALGALSISGVAFANRQYWPENGIKNQCLSGLPDALATHPLMQQVWQGIDPAQVWDTHVHLTGTGDGDVGVWMNPNMNSWLHPVLRVQKNFYMDASCAQDAQVDLSYVRRLAELGAEMPAGFKSMLFAFEWFHDEQGRAVQQHSIFHVPNAYTANIAREHSAYFEWVASIHPYRPDALDALDEAHATGARAIKWLPSGMGIDPASSKCDAFYKKLAKLNMPLISHTGHESAVQGGDQRHGNPLRLRRAMDNGVRVVMAHCASHGEDEDLDQAHRPKVSSLALFFRLMDTPDYQAFAFGETSALALVNHAASIKPILERPDLHGRLLNGSDYPLPGILPLVNTQYLHRLGLLEAEHVPFLQSLKHYNPLMFDFALKRLLALDGVGFPAQTFETRRFFEYGKLSETIQG